MATATAPALAEGRGANLAHARTAAPYENWRPPVIGVSLIVPVGAEALVIADLLGTAMVPSGSVLSGETPEEAALNVLSDATGGLPPLRRVAVACVQMRRRKVITYVLATASITHESVGRLIYRDPRADIRVMPTIRAIDSLPVPGRLRVVVGLQALATGEIAYIGSDHISPMHLVLGDSAITEKRGQPAP
ncbi:hypothetical protein [Streptomyces sp. NPDC005752]|uniref:hypothetical protein n=1 Tax=Streptomyces sp. NPDC005752 TaxID=3157065 RepID=UPI0033C7FBB9